MKNRFGISHLITLRKYINWTRSEDFFESDFHKDRCQEAGGAVGVENYIFDYSDFLEKKPEQEYFSEAIGLGGFTTLQKLAEVTAIHPIKFK